MFTIYSADTAGIPSNCLYPHKHHITDDSSLKKAVLTDYVCAEYKNSLLDTATVYANGSITFLFKNGTEKDVPPDSLNE